jgi:hypothetical protein
MSQADNRLEAEIHRLVLEQKKWLKKGSTVRHVEVQGHMTLNQKFELKIEFLIASLAMQRLALEDLLKRIEALEGE